MFALVIVGFIRKNELIRYVTLLGSLAYIGFIKARLICIVDVLNLLSLNSSHFTGSPFLLLLMAFTVAVAVLWGRVYCGWICPFGAVQEFLERVWPLKVRVPPKLHWIAVKVKYAILLTIVVLFFSLNDLTVAAYVEPFSTLFLLKGSTIMWVILCSILIVSLFVHRFYCRYVCPVGAFLSLLSYLRIFRVKRWSECSSCRICERTCKVQAIKGEKVSVRECISCGTCEKNYLNKDLCPHYRTGEVGRDGP